MTAKRIALAIASALMLAGVLVSVPVVARTTGEDRVAASGEKRVTVRVMDNFFDPRSVGVRAGGKVSFRWKGSNRHNVRFRKVPPGASRKSARTRRHGRWSRKFVKPGLYRYVCTNFAGMRGTITSKPRTAGEGAGRR